MTTDNEKSTALWNSVPISILEIALTFFSVMAYIAWSSSGPNAEAMNLVFAILGLLGGLLSLIFYVVYLLAGPGAFRGGSAPYAGGPNDLTAYQLGQINRNLDQIRQIEQNREMNDLINRWKK